MLLCEVGCYYCCSFAKLCPTLCDPITAARQASTSFTFSQSLLKGMSVESVMPTSHSSRHLLHLPSMFPSIRVFSNESALHIRWPKYSSFSFSIHPFNEHSGLISFRIDWFDHLTVQGDLKSLHQHQFEKVSSSVLSHFYGPVLTSIHDYWKNHGFDYMDLCRLSSVSAF